MSYCCGNPWAPSGPSTQAVCGDFDNPDNPDLGACNPYREKRTCDVPVLPTPTGLCPGEVPVAIYNPGNPSNPFSILTGLYDENCLPILDENDIQITTII